MFPIWLKSESIHEKVMMTVIGTVSEEMQNMKQTLSKQCSSFNGNS